MFFPVFLISTVALLDASRSRRFAGFEMDLQGLSVLGNILPCNALTRCNGKGICEGTETLSKCICFPGYVGEFCEVPSAGFEPFHYQMNPFNGMNNEIYQNQYHLGYAPEHACSSYDCSGHGVCVGSSYQPSCLCNYGRSGLRCEFEFVG